MSKASTIEIVSVTKVYGTTTAVRNISLKIPGGSYCCFLGPSGCGKTTTLRMIAGHEVVTSGDIRLTNCVARLSNTTNSPCGICGNPTTGIPPMVN